jgi:drug/metabolite transporter (DMT)-like permease
MTKSERIEQKQEAIPVNLWFVLAAGVLAMASSSIFIRYAQAEGVSSLVIGMSRLVIAAVILSPVVWARHRPDLARLRRSDFLWAVAAGFFLAIHFAAWVSSLEYTTVLVSTVIVTASPVWVALMEFFFLGKAPTRLMIIGLVIALIGGVVIAAGSAGADTTVSGAEQDNSRQIIGILLSLLGSVAVAAYFTLGKKVRTVLPVIPYIWLVYGCGGLFMIVLVAASGASITGFPPIAYVWLLCCAIFPQLIGHSSLNYAVGYLPATLVSMITQLEPIGSAILAFILFQEFPGVIAILGSVVLLAGVSVASYGDRDAGH